MDFSISGLNYLDFEWLLPFEYQMTVYLVQWGSEYQTLVNLGWLFIYDQKESSLGGPTFKKIILAYTI